MKKPIIGIFSACLLFLLLQACNMPGPGGPTPFPSPTPYPSETPFPSPTPYPASPTPVPPTAVDDSTPTLVAEIMMLVDGLCYTGPGDPYEVVSSLHPSQPLTVLGRGSVPGWLVVDDPIYHNPCWVAETALIIPPGTTFAGLKTYYPPAPPAASAVPSPVASKPPKGPTKVPTVPPKP